MSSPARDLIEGIESFVPIEWARFGPAHNDEQSMSELPFAVWRFKCGTEHEPRTIAVAKLLEECISTFDSEIGWVFEKPNRNWVITTVVARSEWRKREYSSDSEVRAVLAEQQPQLGRAANQEFARLVASILQLLKERLDPPA